MALQVSLPFGIDRESLRDVQVLLLHVLDGPFEPYRELVRLLQLENLADELLEVAAVLVTLPVLRKDAVVGHASVMRDPLEVFHVNVRNPPGIYDGREEMIVGLEVLPANFEEESLDHLALVDRAGPVIASDPEITANSHGIQDVPQLPKGI